MHKADAQLTRQETMFLTCCADCFKVVQGGLLLPCRAGCISQMYKVCVLPVDLAVSSVELAERMTCAGTSPSHVYI